VIVHLPRSLVALFADAGRRAEARGGTVLEVIADLDRRVPGLANRVLDAGPVIRTHLNVFVDGERATVATAVRPGAEVHVIPAISGG
jgi:molybdopterin converting factor small subunit